MNEGALTGEIEMISVADQRTIQPCRSVCYMQAEDAMELLLGADAPTAHGAGQTYRLHLRIEFRE